MEDALVEAGRMLLPALVEAVGVLLMAALTWAAVKFRAKTGLEIEERHRWALHGAIMSGVEAATAKLGKGVPLADIAEAAVKHAQASVPDAINALRPGAGVLVNIALAKAEALLAAKAPTPPAAG